MSKKYEITAIAYNKRGRVIAVGHNSYEKTHPAQAKFGRKSGKPNAIFLHAELACLLRAKEKVHRLEVFRYDNDGKPANSKPCPSCQLAIKAYGVKEVRHT